MFEFVKRADGELYPQVEVRDGETALAATERALKIRLGRQEIAKARNERERRRAEAQLRRMITPQVYTSPLAQFVGELRARIAERFRG